MGFKGLFSLLFAHRIMTFIIGIILAITLFAFISDVQFMKTAFDGASTYIIRNTNALVSWGEEMARNIADIITKSFEESTK